MRIGVKYCGGCNSHYNRREQIKKLAGKYETVRFEPVEDGKDYDIVLLVCGCMRTCIREYRSAAAGQWFVLQSEENFDEIEKVIM